MVLAGEEGYSMVCVSSRGSQCPCMVYACVMNGSSLIPTCRWYPRLQADMTCGCGVVEYMTINVQLLDEARLVSDDIPRVLLLVGDGYTE